MRKHWIAAAFGACMLAAQPATAQESAYTPGTYMVVQGIYVNDGQLENYMDYLAGMYRRNQDFAKSKGWISGYRIFANVNRRKDEPNLYLLTEMPRLPTPQEEADRERQITQAMNQTTRQATEASGGRVQMRTLGNNMLLQELNLRPSR